MAKGRVGEVVACYQQWKSTRHSTEEVWEAGWCSSGNPEKWKRTVGRQIVGAWEVLFGTSGSVIFGGRFRKTESGKHIKHMGKGSPRIGEEESPRVNWEAEWSEAGTLCNHDLPFQRACLSTSYLQQICEQESMRFARPNQSVANTFLSQKSCPEQLQRELQKKVDFSIPWKVSECDSWGLGWKQPSWTGPAVDTFLVSSYRYFLWWPHSYLRVNKHTTGVARCFLKNVFLKNRNPDISSVYSVLTPIPKMLTPQMLQHSFLISTVKE